MKRFPPSATAIVGATLMLGGCSHHQPSRSPAATALDIASAPAADPEELEVSLWVQHSVSEPPILSVTLGDERVTLRGTGPQASPATARLAVSGPDTLSAHLVLHVPTRDTLAVAALAMPVVPGHVHWLRVTVTPRRPAGMCVGEVTGVPIRASAAGWVTAGDSMFVAYGSLPRGAEC